MLCFLKCTSGTLLSQSKMQRWFTSGFSAGIIWKALITSKNGNITSKISVRPAEQRCLSAS